METREIYQAQQPVGERAPENPMPLVIIPIG